MAYRKKDILERVGHVMEDTKAELEEARVQAVGQVKIWQARLAALETAIVEAERLADFRADKLPGVPIVAWGGQKVTKRNSPPGVMQTMVLDAVQATPGIGASKIAQITGLTTAQVGTAVQALKRARKVEAPDSRSWLPVT